MCTCDWELLTLSFCPLYLFTRLQGYPFTNDIKICTGICLSNVPIIQHEQYTTATSPVKNNYQQFNCMYKYVQISSVKYN